MINNFDKYNSTPFDEYFDKEGGNNLDIDYVNRVLHIEDSSSKRIAKVYFSSAIQHHFDSNDLLNKSKDVTGKVYFIYENGTHGYDWLWYYDVILIDFDLL